MTKNVVQFPRFGVVPTEEGSSVDEWVKSFFGDTKNRHHVALKAWCKNAQSHSGIDFVISELEGALARAKDAKDNGTNG